eukprot:m51a1_g8701 putative map kinase phosphatase (185) ;mRNA; r:88620-89265
MEQPALPPLPPLPSDEADMAGPHAHANWLVPGRLLVGALPRSSLLAAALAAGVTVFVSLLTDSERAASGGAYESRARDCAASLRLDPSRLEFLRYPGALGMAREVARRVREGRAVYVHCMGGHGRTGTLGALVVAELYGLGASEAVALVQRCHADRAQCRQCPGRFTSPETHEQRAQVYRVLRG